MEYTYYGFRNCVGGYFEMPTSDARKILPAHLQPLELQHTRSIFAITAFEFTESLVGPYNEVVLAVVVPPLVEAGKPLPKAAFYPFMVATDTVESRDHAMERWHLPHFMDQATITFTRSEGRMDVSVRDGDAPVLELVVTEHGYGGGKHLYNCFMSDADGNYKANIFIEAPHCEHEEEGGSLKLYPHPMTAALTIADVATMPFREEWYGEGLQTFEPLERI